MININNIEVNTRFTEKHYFNETLFETKNFKVIPTLGSLIEGWLLVLPKRHFISFGAINNDHLYNELDILLSKLSIIVEREYGNYIIFEHGPVLPQTLVGCGVDYAHLHIVPINIDLIQKSSKYLNSPSWVDVTNIRFVREYFKADIPYLLFQDSSRTVHIGTDKEIPSQVFRKVIAEHLKIVDEYDWKQFQFEGIIKNTIEKYSKFNKDISLTKELYHEGFTK
jgi:hypothetical protein